MELLNLDVVREYGGSLLQGLAITVVLTFIVITMALILAIPVALIRMSPNFLLRTIGSIYVEVIRGTPLLLQLAYIYYVMPGFGLNLDPFSAAILGLTLNYTAYMSEVYRGGILAVPKHQWEAAATVGMTKAIAFYRIILPQAIKRMVPPFVNQSIIQLKNTSLLYVVAVPDLMYTGSIIVSDTFRPLEVYTSVAAIYFAILYPLTLWASRMEAKVDQ